jgi:hypothetical protein
VEALFPAAPATAEARDAAGAGDTAPDDAQPGTASTRAAAAGKGELAGTHSGARGPRGRTGARALTADGDCAQKSATLKYFALSRKKARQADLRTQRSTDSATGKGSGEGDARAREAVKACSVLPSVVGWAERPSEQADEPIFAPKGA